MSIRANKVKQRLAAGQVGRQGRREEGDGEGNEHRVNRVPPDRCRARRIARVVVSHGCSLLAGALASVGNLAQAGVEAQALTWHRQTDNSDQPGTEGVSLSGQVHGGETVW